MSRPRKPDALSAAERARRYRVRFAGRVTETVTETVTEMFGFAACEWEWPFPGSECWYRKYGFVRVSPSV